MTLKICLAAVVLGTLQISPAAAQDWSGWYAGASLESNANSTWEFTFNGSPTNFGDYDSGAFGGVFAGYNIQRGNVVYGGEIAFSPSDLRITPNSSFERWADLKGHVGYATGRALVYGTIGYTVSDYLDGTNALKPTGLNYGLGVNYQISDRIFAGAEYLVRDLNADYPGVPGLEFDTAVKTLSLRVGMTF